MLSDALIRVELISLDFNYLSPIDVTLFSKTPIFNFLIQKYLTYFDGDSISPRYRLTPRRNLGSNIESNAIPKRIEELPDTTPTVAFACADVTLVNSVFSSHFLLNSSNYA